MIVHVCDRCKGNAVALPARSILIPHDDPAALSCVADLSVSVSAVSGADLCVPCAASALVEYAIVLAGGNAAILGPLTARLTEAQA